MNEITSVTRNGSWVRMMVKISAGSSGARRAHSPERRSADDGTPGPAPAPGRPVSTATLMMVPLVSSSARASPSLVLPRSVPFGHVVRQLLPAFQGFGHAHLAGDRRADVLGHLGAQPRELRDVDELDARRRPWLHPRVQRVGVLDRALGRCRESLCLVQIFGDLVGGCPLAGRYPGPAERAADQLFVVLAGGPGDELPGV